jgi:hypothetical protein
MLHPTLLYSGPVAKLEPHDLRETHPDLLAITDRSIFQRAYHLISMLVIFKASLHVTFRSLIDVTKAKLGRGVIFEVSFSLILRSAGSLIFFAGRNVCCLTRTDIPDLLTKQLSSHPSMLISRSSTDS